MYPAQALEPEQQAAKLVLPTKHPFDGAWVRGPWIDARNLRAIAMACAGRIRGVYLCRGGGRGRLGDRQELLGDWNPELFQQIGQLAGDFCALNNTPALATVAHRFQR
jgi:hypothetical protein